MKKMECWLYFAPKGDFQLLNLWKPFKLDFSAKWKNLTLKIGQVEPFYIKFHIKTLPCEKNTLPAQKEIELIKCKHQILRIHDQHHFEKQWIVIISLKNFFPNKSFSFYASILISLMCIVLPTKSTFDLFKCRYHLIWI